MIILHHLKSREAKLIKSAHISFLIRVLFMSPWQLLAEMGDNHWSGQKGIKSSLLSAYCVGNLLCYEEQCADVFSVSISFTVWAATCRTSLLLHGNPTRKETHQAHFVRLISYPPATNAVPPTHQTSLINF